MAVAPASCRVPGYCPESYGKVEIEADPGDSLSQVCAALAVSGHRVRRSGSRPYVIQVCKCGAEVRCYVEQDSIGWVLRMRRHRPDALR